MQGNSVFYLSVDKLITEGEGCTISEFMRLNLSFEEQEDVAELEAAGAITELNDRDEHKFILRFFSKFGADPW